MDGVLSALCKTEEEFFELIGPVIQNAELNHDSQNQVDGGKIFVLGSVTTNR